jgi:hypothetical protein
MLLHVSCVSPGCDCLSQAQQLPWQPAVGCGAWCLPPATCCAVLWLPSWLWQQTTTAWEGTWLRGGSHQVGGSDSSVRCVCLLLWSLAAPLAVLLVALHQSCKGAKPDAHVGPFQLCSHLLLSWCGCVLTACCTRLQARQWRRPGVHATRQQHSGWRCSAATCPHSRPLHLW